MCRESPPSIKGVQQLNGEFTTKRLGFDQPGWGYNTSFVQVSLLELTYIMSILHGVGQAKSPQLHKPIEGLKQWKHSLTNVNSKFQNTRRDMKCTFKTQRVDWNLWRHWGVLEDFFISEIFMLRSEGD